MSFIDKHTDFEPSYLLYIQHIRYVNHILSIIGTWHITYIVQYYGIGINSPLIRGGRVPHKASFKYSPCIHTHTHIRNLNHYQITSSHYISHNIIQQYQRASDIYINDMHIIIKHLNLKQTTFSIDSVSI